MAGRNPKSGEGDGEGVGEKGLWVEAGEKLGVPERELPSDTNITAASHSSNSNRDKSGLGGGGGGGGGGGFTPE